MKPSSRFSGNRFRSAVRHFVVGRLAQAIATVAVTFLAVRLLSPGEYGLYMVLWGLVELGVPMTSLGFLPAAQRFLPELAERGSQGSLRRFVYELMAIRIGLIVLGALAVGCSWPVLSAWMGSPDSRVSVAWLAAVMLAFVLISRFSAEMLECLLEQRYAQTSRAVLPFIRAFGFVALWVGGKANLVNLLWIDVVAALIAMILGEVWLARSVGALNPLGNHSIPRRDFATFVWHMSGAQVLNAVSSVGTLRLVVARLLGVEVAGQFSFLQQLVTIGNRYLPSVLLANMVRPMLIARHANGRVEDVSRGLGLLWKSNLALAWPAVPMMVIAGDEIINFASGGHVRSAGLAMAFMVIGLGARGQHQIVGMALQIFRYTKLIRAESLLSLLAPVLLFAFVGYGIEGMAFAICVGLVLRSAISLWLLQRREFTIALDWVGAARLLLSLLAATGLAYIVGVRLGPLVGVVILLASYCAFAFVCRPVEAREWGLVKRGIGQRASWLSRLVR